MVTYNTVSDHGPKFANKNRYFVTILQNIIILQQTMSRICPNISHSNFPAGAGKKAQQLRLRLVKNRRSSGRIPASGAQHYTSIKTK
jgi:hypothetical protein